MSHYYYLLRISLGFASLCLCFALLYYFARLQANGYMAFKQGGAALSTQNESLNKARMEVC